MNPTPPQAMWFLVIDGEQVGPLSVSDIETHIEGGAAHPSTYVWKMGFSDWMRMSEVEALQHLLQTPSSPMDGDTNPDFSIADRTLVCLNCRQTGLVPEMEICPGCAAYLPSVFSQTLQPASTLEGGKYEVLCALGQGGFGITYRARHLVLGHLVAIKEYFPQTMASRDSRDGALIVASRSKAGFERHKARFTREGRTLMKLKHHGVVTAHDLFEEKGTAYLVMEHIGGMTLRRELELAGGRLDLGRVQEVVRQLVEALAAVHLAGVQHLDIKPDNVMTTEQGRLVLIDFGAARMAGRLSTHTSVAFSEAYAPPEVMAMKEVGPYSDIFSLGMMAHEMLTGRLPPSAIQRFAKVDWDPEHLEPAWRLLIQNALELEANERAQDIREWWGTLTPSTRVVGPTQQESPDASAPPRPRPPRQDSLAEIVGPYTLVERIAIGGMAEIFRARKKDGSSEDICIKRLHPRYSEDRDFMLMLIDEAKILSHLNHKNIVRFHEIFQVEDSRLIAMEFVDGKDLYQVLKRLGEEGRRMPIGLAAYTIMEVCAGLDHTHRKTASDGTPLGIIHRDASPQNVIISWQGEVKLIDFGISKSAMRAFETEPGVIKGKFYYMSPEQSRGGNLDARTDIFTLGISLYELLTNRVVYASEDDSTLLSRVRRAEIPPPTVWRPEIPLELNAIVMRALAPDPSRRFQTMVQFRMALSTFLRTQALPSGAEHLADFMHGLYPPPPPLPSSEEPDNRDEKRGFFSRFFGRGEEKS